MVLDREEEMKRNFGPNGGSGYQGDPYNDQNVGGYNLNQMRQDANEAPNMSHIQPKQKKYAAGQKANDDDDDAGWGNTASLLD